MKRIIAVVILIGLAAVATLANTTFVNFHKSGATCFDVGRHRTPQ